MKFSVLGRHLFAASLATSAITTSAAASEFSEALSLTRPLLDMRLRYEFVDQEPLPRNANAVTLRVRPGFETGKVWGTSLLADADWILPISDAYNNGFNGKTQYPVVGDPKAIELNRLHLTNISIPSTAITLGRQRIALDDHRFIGNVPWRQNEQTLDALRVVNKSISGLTIDAAYFNQINRVFGNYSPVGRYRGDSGYINTAYQFDYGKLTGFAYLIDIEQAAGIRDSSQSYGVRFAGSTPMGAGKVGYIASYAKQYDWAHNPLSYDADYYLAELSGTYMQYTLTGGYEVLTGDGIKGFTTPLATLFKFNGWADKFLALTPVNGLRDIYVMGTYARPNVGPFTMVGADVTYHTYKSSRLSLDYGDEINIQLQAKWDRFLFSARFADYKAKGFATDTKKAWLLVEFAL